MIDRRRFGAGASSLLLSGCVGTGGAPIQVNAVAAPAPGDPHAARMDTGTDASLRITAPVRINGQGPFNFVVDTGANRTVVSVELAASLGLPDGGPANVHGVAGVESTPTAIVELLEVDTVAVKVLRVPALTRERLGADGLLGVDVLHDRRVIMNFLERRLTIGVDRSQGDLSSFDLRRAQTRAGGDLGRRIAVPARYRFGQLIIIGADVSGSSVIAFLDSGSQSTVGNNALRERVLGSHSAYPTATRTVVPVLSATGQIARGELGQMPLLRIGGMDITGLSTVFADLHVFQIWGLLNRPSLLLGMDILSRFNAIELNYSRREVAFYLPGKGRTG